MASQLNEGVRRLSLVLGLLGLVPWVVMFAFWLSVNTGKLWHKPVEQVVEENIAQEEKDWSDHVRFDRAQYDAEVARLGKQSTGIAPPTEEELQRWGRFVEEARKEHKEQMKMYVEGLQKYEVETATKELAFYVLNSLPAFFIPWGIVRVIAWIVTGFRNG